MRRLAAPRELERGRAGRGLPLGHDSKATPEANRATSRELSDAEASEIRARAGHYLETFDYKSFVPPK